MLPFFLGQVHIKKAFIFHLLCILIYLFLSNGISVFHCPQFLSLANFCIARSEKESERWVPRRGWFSGGLQVVYMYLYFINCRLPPGATAATVALLPSRWLTDSVALVEVQHGSFGQGFSCPLLWDL